MAERREPRAARAQAFRGRARAGLLAPFAPPLACCLLLFALLGCGGDPRSGRLGFAGPGEGGTVTTSVRVLPEQPQVGGELTVSFAYEVQPATRLVGAYVATIRFDPALVSLVALDGSLFDGDEPRVANTEQAPAGSIVVAGASPAGFSDRVLLRGTFRALAPGVTPASFGLVLQEASDTRLNDLLR
jgi:hypothetical protein